MGQGTVRSQLDFGDVLLSDLGPGISFLFLLFALCEKALPTVLVMSVISILYTSLTLQITKTYIVRGMHSNECSCS